jgi:hypothetical protein
MDKADPMADKLPFEQFYETALLPALLPLEECRRRIARNIILCCGGTALLALLITGLLLAYSHDPYALFVPLFVAATIITLIFKWLSASYVNDFKNQVVALIVKYIDPDLTYRPQSGISQERFLAGGIFRQRIDRYRCEDMVQGTVEKTRIEFSEVHAEYKTETRDSKGRRHTQWHTIFKGLYFIADFNKHFRGKTFVLPDTAEKLLGRFGLALQSLDHSHGELVKLEDPAFEKEFAVYGTDQVEARYILSPSLMHRLLEFKRKTGSTVYFSFRGGEVNIGISSDKNRFEPKIFSTVLDIELAREFVADLQLALGIVEDLNLNTRIWTKD